MTAHQLASSARIESEIPTPDHILSAAELSRFNPRSNRQGSLRLGGHLATIAISGYVWAMYPVAIPCLVIYGFSLAAMFATMHECCHRTAFANNQVNDAVAWWAGVLSFYNGTFYRRYHKWHHRYTRIPGKDPELTDRTPDSLYRYGLELTGLPWWWGKLRGHSRIALGILDEYPYIPAPASAEVIRSTRLQLLVYAIAIGVSIGFAQPWFVMYWLLPLAVGQPLLRFVLLAEHTGCTLDDNSLTNTRTTLTWAPLRYLMWNMPFHAEHHLHPSIPFHALPAAHERLKSHFRTVDPGYVRVNLGIISKLESRWS
ncbi:fatty acid desaturase family protein [Chamaesiphon sp.]|uniref:fatty acid desaturase family protein n=1 Tax=Chamaesiphon sp. TaxID=2814140 RepID=UPI0035940FEA